MRKISVISTVILAVMLFLSLSVLPLSADTAQTAEVTEKTENGVILETVNLTFIKKNKKGEGYYWDNINNTLTLTNLTIDTSDNFGLRLPEDCTLVLEGKNIIRASDCALSLEGNLTVRGKGSLTLYSDNYGIRAYSTDMNKKLTFKEGSININSAGDGIYSEYVVVTQNDKAKLDINTGEGAYSVNARQVKLLGGSFTANSSIFSRDIKVSNIKLSITSAASAFIINGASEGNYEKLKLSNVKITSGESEGTLKEAETYNGEKCIFTVPHKKYTKASLVLEWIIGKEISGTGYIDFVLIALGILIVGVFIATPYIKNKRDKQKIEAAKAAAREEEKLNMKEINDKKYSK